jgi:hypothetical protein
MKDSGATATLWLMDGFAAVGNGAGQPVVATGRRRMVDHDAWWIAADRPFRAGQPCQLLRGGCVRALGWRHLPTGWNGVAARCRPSERCLQDRLAMDRSSYSPYPGYWAIEGALGEYNGKFMVNQLVLRGSSLATLAGHSRITYRNFFYPHHRWQFTGLRLADYA